MSITLTRIYVVIVDYPNGANRVVKAYTNQDDAIDYSAYLKTKHPKDEVRWSETILTQRGIRPL